MAAEAIDQVVQEERRVIEECGYSLLDNSTQEAWTSGTIMLTSWPVYACLPAVRPPDRLDWEYAPRINKPRNPGRTGIPVRRPRTEATAGWD